jgi:hypothetical protein
LDLYWGRKTIFEFSLNDMNKIFTTDKLSMSFSWVGNAWSGPFDSLDYFPGAINYIAPPPTATVTANFPQHPLVKKQIPQQMTDNYEYQIPEYLLLKDMSADKTPLVFQRGGYMGLNPTSESIAKCAALGISGNYYCNGPQIKPHVQLLGTYGP